jgi:hypothetical protein
MVDYMQDEYDEPQVIDDAVPLEETSLETIDQRPVTAEK